MNGVGDTLSGEGKQGGTAPVGLEHLARLIVPHIEREDVVGPDRGSDGLEGGFGLERRPCMKPISYWPAEVGKGPAGYTVGVSAGYQFLGQGGPAQTNS